MLNAVIQRPCYSQADSLEALLKTDIADTTRMNTLHDLAWELQHNKPGIALDYAQQLLDLAEKLAHQKGMGRALHTIGCIKGNIGDYSSALKYFNKALNIWEELSSKKGISAILNSIGNVYLNQGDFPKALEYYFKTLQIDEELGDKLGIAVDLGNIGIVYHSLEEYNNALKYYFKSLKINEDMGNKVGIASTLGNMGLAYTDQGEYHKALEYYFKSLKANEETERKNGISINLSNIGITYEYQGDSAFDAGDSALAMSDKYPKAMEYYFEALEMGKEIGAKGFIALNLGNIGFLYVTLKKYVYAERYLLQALALADSIGRLVTVEHVNQNLSELYEKTRRYQKALEHYKQYNAAKDSLFNEEKSKEIGKLEARHEFETAEIERKRLEEARRAASAIAERRRNNLQYSGILIFIVLLFAGLFALGKFSIPVRVAEGMIFFSFLLFFEFTLVMLDPYIEEYSSGAPAIKLAFNAILAGLIFPLHSFFESKLKRRIVK